MSEADIEPIKPKRVFSTNDVYSPDFESKLDPGFRSAVGSRQVGWRSYEIDGDRKRDTNTR